MSEYLNKHSIHSAKLLEYCRKLLENMPGRELYDSYKPYIENVTAEEAMQVLDSLLKSDIPFELVKENVGKIMNVFYKSLNSKDPVVLPESHFLNFMMLENREMESLMQKIKELLKSLAVVNELEKTKLLADIRNQVELLKPYELHYVKKENILFPLIEKRFPDYRCIHLMWSFHDDFRNTIKTLSNILNSETIDIKQLNSEMGKLFFVVLPIIFREEKVVFPVALKYLLEEDWKAMLEQSLEVGWCYINEPWIQKVSGVKSEPFHSGGLVDLFTGLLTPEQIVLMMETLPLDITYIDENDEVRYFSGAKHRIFPRSKAIIGRKVQNCHPQSSVHVVNQIVDAFRSGTKDIAEFWIQMRGRFIHIRYFALRDEERNYKGTIEVSQDVTGIRQLEGEQRLLDWK